MCVPLPGVLEPGAAAGGTDWGGGLSPVLSVVSLGGLAEGSCGVRGGMVTPALLLIKPLTP